MQIFRDVEDKYGPIDRVVRAAGIMPSSGILEYNRESIQRVMDIGYMGTVNGQAQTPEAAVDAIDTALEKGSSPPIAISWES